MKPTHYFVVRSPFAQAIICGQKAFEFRSQPKMFENKTLALAVARNTATEEEIDFEIAGWKMDEKQKNEYKNLISDKSMAGMIVGQVEFGESENFSDEKDNPDFGIFIESFILWPRSEWIISPGGLGIRKIPQV